MTVEYWKSAPYFTNFMDGYKIGERVKRSLDDPAAAAQVRTALERTNRLDPVAIESFGPVDAANAKLRRLRDDTVDAGWWRLLWMPPSLPYLRPRGVWAEESLQGMTKRLVFSSWTATPTAVAGLLSYEADRRIAEGSRHVSNTAEGRRRLASRLDFRLADGRPAAMTALALFWPQPALARLADPLELTRRRGDGEPIDSTAAAAEVMQALRSSVSDGSSTSSAAEAWTWTMAVRLGGELPAGLDVADVLTGMTGAEDDDTPSDPTGLSRHVDQALAALAGADPEVERPSDLLASVVALALHAPGNIAWRAVKRLCTIDDDVTEQGLWRAAAVISSGLRTLFNRYQTSLLLDQLYPQAEPYWRVVLAACADGNLQAVLDEHLFLLRSAGRSLDDDGLLGIAQEVRAALTVKLATYQASSPLDDGRSVSFPSRFALRYGAKQSGNADDSNVSRMAEVRTAFNSPFWPFVLATTSAGQEGIDFHLWCHAVFHWNTPASPVDFEQREGRVHRYGGHAVRRNVAHEHAQAVLSAESEEHPWAIAWRCAADRVSRPDELAPYWIYPGPFRIERHVAPFPLSRDLPKLQSLKQDLALYRLAFGQPRQEDLVTLLAQRGTNVDEHQRVSTIDLRPPRCDAGLLTPREE